MLSQVKIVKIDNKNVKSWFLDSPISGVLVDVSKEVFQLQGWVLLENPADKFPYLLLENEDGLVHLQVFNTRRPDVIERVLHESPDMHPQIFCGFAAKIPAAVLVKGFRLGVKVANYDPMWLAQVSFSESMKVIEGSDGWLFLDNDTNHSVAQFTGKVLLNEKQLSDWERYFYRVMGLVQNKKIRHAFMIASTKEEVLPDFYPFKRATVTVLDQVCSMARPEWNVLNTAPLLANYEFPELCFKKTDTHWTDRGAMLAVIGFLEHLDFDLSKVKKIFDEDVYEFRKEVGDLGCKLLPARFAETEFLRAQEPEQGAIFDNKLPNIGRTIVFENEQAVFRLRMVIFGASSSYSMLKYFKRIFSRIVFVHSVANIDLEVVEQENPDILLLQTHARFLMGVPSANFSLRDAVCKKLGELSCANRSKIMDNFSESSFNSKEILYSDMLSKALQSNKD